MNDRGFAPRRIRPLTDFLHAEAAGGIVLVAATIVALVWANSPWSGSYVSFWSTDLSISVGSRTLALDLSHWVNDALMAIFFLVVGLEIKRELAQGELSNPRRAALPAAAAIGGMVIPALIYLAVTGGSGDAGQGWGIPMATDIAMAVGVVALLGSRVHPSLKIFLLALAIVDDIGAIIVIAVVYSDSVDMAMLAAAAAAVVAIVVLRRAGVQWLPAYLVVGAGMWLALHEAGLHATLAGVICGLLAPTVAYRSTDLIDVDELTGTEVTNVDAAHRLVTQARSSVSVVEWLQHLLHPWSTFVIVPLFALANAGVPISSSAVNDALGSPAALGIVLGLVVGKPVGIMAVTWLAVRSGLAEMPTAVSWRAMAAVSSIAGIGFTVSLFITDLAFDDAGLADEARLGVLAASTISGVVGAALVVTAHRTRRQSKRGDVARVV